MVLNTFQTEKAVSHLFAKELYVFRVDQVGALELENMDVIRLYFTRMNGNNQIRKIAMIN